MVSEEALLKAVTAITEAALANSAEPTADNGKAVAAFIETVTNKLRSLLPVGDNRP